MAQNQVRIPVTDFDPNRFVEDPSMVKWERLQFKKAKVTDYQLVHSGDTSYIMGMSNNSASGLIYSVNIDPREYPIIEWTWKVNTTNPESSLCKKKGDDFPVRIFITFEYPPSQLKVRDKLKYFAIKTFSRHQVPLRALNYVWTHEEEEGSMNPNPFTKWVYNISAEQGEERTGSWIMKTRNIYKDYKNAFGEEPMRITGVAIMTDSDNTKVNSQGYYGDIVFKASESSNQ